MKALYITLAIVSLWLNCAGWYQSAEEPHKIVSAIFGTIALVLFAHAHGYWLAICYYEGDQEDKEGAEE